MNEFIAEYYPYLNGVIAVAIAWCFTRLTQLLTSKIKSAYFSGAVSRLMFAIHQAIKTVQRTTVDALKEKSVGGLTDAEIKEIQQIALTTIKSYLGIKGIKEIMTVFGVNSKTIDGFLLSFTESALFDFKKENPSPLTFQDSPQKKGELRG